MIQTIQDFRYNSDQAQMYQSIVKTSREAARKLASKESSPREPPIQNRRSSFIGDRFCRDGYHLSLDLGRYTAACTWFEFLTGKSVVGNPFSPRTITPLEATTVQRAAHEAVLNPFEITSIDLRMSWPHRVWLHRILLKETPN